MSGAAKEQNATAEIKKLLSLTLAQIGFFPRRSSGRRLCLPRIELRNRKWLATCKNPRARRPVSTPTPRSFRQESLLGGRSGACAGRHRQNHSPLSPSVLLTKAIRVLSGDHEGTLIVPCPPNT